MKVIIENIQNTLASIPELKYVDENWGQLDNYSPNYPVKWPVALIDVRSAQFSNIGREKGSTPVNRQMASYNLEVRLANLKLTNTSARAPQSQKDKARSIWELIEEVHVKLHGFRPSENSSALIRTSLARVEREDGVQEYIILYSSELSNV